MNKESPPLLHGHFKTLIWCMRQVTHVSGGTHKPQIHHTMCKPPVRYYGAIMFQPESAWCSFLCKADGGVV